MLLPGKRQELHGRVATVLEQKFPDLVERQPEFSWPIILPLPARLSMQ